MDDREEDAMAPPYACQSCAARDAIVFCPVDGARLCLHCDVDVHGASTLAGLHQRAPLCDFCGGAAAAMRCAATFMVCTDCQCLFDPPGPTRADVTAYTGCPDPTELMCLLSVEAPPQQEELDDWLHHHLLLLKLDDDAAVATNRSGGGGMCDVAIAAAKIEKLLSSDIAAAAGGSLCSNGNHDGNKEEENETKRTMTQDEQHKRQERERAKLRYNEKKKNRSFCKHIMYASRKQTADTRVRIKGRFAKASPSSEPHLIPSMP